MPSVDLSLAPTEALLAGSGGNPFWVAELVHAGTSDGHGAISPDDLLARRLENLGGSARTLLEVVAVAGAPVDMSTAFRAAGVDLPVDAFDTLRANRLVAQDLNDRIGVVHDRIREAIVGLLPLARQRALHRMLAEALEESSPPDLEALALYFAASDVPERAASYAEAAGDEANDALAFDRATRFYEIALHASRTSPDGAGGVDSELWDKLGETRARAGRGREAADAFLASAALSSGATAVDRRRRAAQEMLVSGHIDEGLSLAREVLSSLRLSVPSTSREAVVSLLWFRAKLRLRGLGFRRRKPDEIPPEERLRVDTTFALAKGLSFVDSILGARFQAENLIRALDAGDPSRVVLGLAGESAFSASEGTPSRQRTEALLRYTHRVRAETSELNSLGLSLVTEGMAYYLMGDLGEARAKLEESILFLRDKCRGVTWELDSANYMLVTTLHWMGRGAELAELDERFRDCMVATVRRLFDCGFGVVYGYTQSGEISLLFGRDEQAFGRKLRKLNSVLAGEASAAFTHELGARAAFDCRVSQLPTRGGCSTTSDGAKRTLTGTRSVVTVTGSSGGAASRTERLPRSSTAPLSPRATNCSSRAVSTSTSYRRGRSAASASTGKRSRSRVGTPRPGRWSMRRDAGSGSTWSCR